MRRNVNTSIHVRLKRANEILVILERRRLLTSDPNLGTSIERQIVDRELSELAAEARVDEKSA